MASPLAFNVAPASGVPIYRQLVEQVRARAAGGHLAPGDWLPSVRALAEQLQVNPMTVSKAYSILERDRVIEHVRGTGMRVLPPGRAADGRARRAALLPLLRQVAHAARQLSLAPDEVVEQLRPLLEENDDKC